MDFHKFEKILNQSGNLLEKMPIKEKTFMDISGYPHYENVCSNILAFYFNPKEEHGMKEFVLCSFIKVLMGKNKNINIDLNNTIKDISVQREYITQKGNRIDLVMQNNELVIGIENKLDASVYNDLKDYADTLNMINTKSIKVLLSLHDNTKVVENTEFINISYQEFLNQLKKDLNVTQIKSNKWLIFLEEFIKNLENFEGEWEMEKEIINWLNENQNEIDAFDKVREIAYKSIERKQEELKAKLEEKLKVNYIKIWKGKNDITCYIDSPNKYHVDVKLTPSGWRIGIFTWTTIKSNRVKQIIVNSDYDIIEDETNHRWLYQFKYETTVEEILNKMIEVFEFMENAIIKCK